MTEVTRDGSLARQDGRTELELITPLVIDLGSTAAKRVKRLKKGQGKLMREVEEVLDEVAVALGDDLDGKTVLPVIMIYRQKKAKKRRRLVLPF